MRGRVRLPGHADGGCDLLPGPVVGNNRNARTIARPAALEDDGLSAMDGTLPVWTPEQIDAVDRAIASARAGRATVLLIEGESGAGRTALLRETVSRAAGFAVLTAEGIPGEGTRTLAVVRKWGGSVQANTHPFQAAQELRDVVDGLASTGPVLLAVDDLQWLDPDSVEAIGWLLRRSDADRLLVAATRRPAQAGGHVGGDLAATDVPTVRIEPAGLSGVAAASLVRALRPDADDHLIDRLRAHTAGNPFYLRTLARSPRLTGSSGSGPLRHAGPARQTRA